MTADLAGSAVAAVSPTPHLWLGFQDKWKHIHTSGHATVEDLGRLVEAVAPKQLVPIHTFHGDEYGMFKAPVLRLKDSEEFDLATSR